MLSRITRQLSEMRTALNTPLHGLFKYLSHSLFYHIVRLCQGLSLSLHLKNEFEFASQEPFTAIHGQPETPAISGEKK